MVSETEAIAELSCTREHPSLIHYAARYGQVIHTRAHKHMQVMRAVDFIFSTLHIECFHSLQVSRWIYW